MPRYKIRPEYDKEVKYEVTAIECRNCKDILFSRALYDLRTCSCKESSVTGGLDSFESFGNNLNIFKLRIVQNSKELFDDWNLGIDKYGHIKYKNADNKRKGYGRTTEMSERKKERGSFNDSGNRDFKKYFEKLEKEEEKKMAISLKDYLTASGKFPERENSAELTNIYLENAKFLLESINGLLHELGVQNPIVSSGFRPVGVNSAIGGAKKSSHCICKAVDLLDDSNQTLAKMITPNLLRKYGLFMEDEQQTIGKHTNWVHLDNTLRPDRPSRKFKA